MKPTLFIRYRNHGGVLDVRSGLRLFGDREVRAGQKIGALAAGVVLTLLAVGLALPLEGIVGFFLPIIGPMLSAFMDGAELITLPIILGSLLLLQWVKSASISTENVHAARRNKRNGDN